MNYMMLQCLALCTIVMVATSAPATNSKFQRDKLKLNNLIREMGDTIDELELDIADAEKREEEPAIEAEISEDETQARKEEERGNKDKKEELEDKSSLRDVLRMLLKLENSERSSTDNANDNHDFPMPLAK